MRARALAAGAEVAAASVAAAPEGGWEITADRLQRDASWDDGCGAANRPETPVESAAGVDGACASAQTAAAVEFFPRDATEAKCRDGAADASCGGRTGDDGPGGDSASRGGPPWLFALPAECNFSGARMDLDLIPALQVGGAGDARSSRSFRDLPDHSSSIVDDSHGSSTLRARAPQARGWMVVLDAAKACATHPPDLSRWKPEFVVLSFYKARPSRTAPCLICIAATAQRRADSYQFNIIAADFRRSGWPGSAHCPPRRASGALARQGVLWRRNGGGRRRTGSVLRAAAGRGGAGGRDGAVSLRSGCEAWCGRADDPLPRLQLPAPC